MRRRHRFLRRFWPLIGAILLVTGVLYVGSTTFSTKDSQIVVRAAAIRRGDEAAERPPAPAMAIDLLRAVVQRSPNHYDAFMELASCWADLRAYDNAVNELQRAAGVAKEMPDRIRALRRARSFLTLAQRYDEGVELAREIAALQPEKEVYGLHVGLALYEGSVGSQRDLSVEYRIDGLFDEGVPVTDDIEAFITDIWSSPDPEPLVDKVLADGDVITRRRFREELQAVRDKFVQAEEILDTYRYYPAFDQAVCRAFVKMLHRTGRLYQAHIESGMAMREPNLPAPVMREFLETQAFCNLEVGESLQAAERFTALVDGYEAADMWPPPHYIHLVYEARIAAESWDWILEHVDEDTNAYGKGDSVIFRWAKAAALTAVGRRDEARETMREPFAEVALGSQRSFSGSVRRFPERRHDILLLAHELYKEVGDSRSSTAIDALIRDFPADSSTRRLRIEGSLEEGRLEAALDDALQLLTLPERDRDDFDLWLGIADDLSQIRRGLSLTAHAEEIVDDAETWRQKHGDALFIHQRAGGRPVDGAFSEVPIQLHWPQDPALSFTIVQELIRRNDLESARNNLRRLIEIYPDLHELRFHLGRLLVRDGMLESASTEFQELLAELPGDTEVLDMAMRTDVALGRNEAAAELLNRMILEDPLGVGAVRYGQRLLEEGRPDKAAKLIQRLLNWDEELGQRRDILILSGRIHIAEGDFETAEAILGTLANQHSDSVDVAILAANLGLEQRNTGLLEDAMETLKPLAGSIFPDRMPVVAQRLLDAGMYEELLFLFDENLRVLPAAKPALRSVIRAAAALGRIDEADELFSLLDDDHAALDRFLLMTLHGGSDEAGRRLRLEVVPSHVRDIIELCLMVRTGLMGHQALLDVSPVRQLSEMRLETVLDARGLELMDALLRLSPRLKRLESLLPTTIVTNPLAVYPLAGSDVAVLIDVARTDPDRARDTIEMLYLMLLMGERPFWQREVRFMAEEVLAEVPEITFATHVLVAEMLETGEGEAALDLLKPLVIRTDRPPDGPSLQLFMQASKAANREAWGIAVALQMAPLHANVRRILADALREGGHAAESIEHYEVYLEAVPDDPVALGGIIQALSTQRKDGATEAYIRRALDLPPTDELATICADALFTMFKPTPRAVMLMEQMFDSHPGLVQVSEALARTQVNNPSRVDDILGVLIDRIRARPVDADSEAGTARAKALVRAVETARRSGLTGRARELNALALRQDPGSINRYREMAFLELEDGHLEPARRYLEVLSFINLTDRDAAQALAQLYAEQLGRPLDAAEVVRRTFLGQPPPWAVSILAAEDYLLGDPQAAINKFSAVRGSPLLSDSVYYSVARIAYASGMTDTARNIIEYVTSNGDREHPFFRRAHWLLRHRLAPPAVESESEPESASLEAAAKTVDRG